MTTVLNKPRHDRFRKCRTLYIIQLASWYISSDFNCVHIVRKSTKYRGSPSRRAGGWLGRAVGTGQARSGRGYVSNVHAHVRFKFGFHGSCPPTQLRPSGLCNIWLASILTRISYCNRASRAQVVPSLSRQSALLVGTYAIVSFSAREG